MMEETAPGFKYQSPPAQDAIVTTDRSIWQISQHRPTSSNSHNTAYHSFQ